MTAFISYSLSDDDYEDIVAPLAWRLKDQGFYASTGMYYTLSDTLSEEVRIKSAHLFIGILIPTKTKAATSEILKKRVINEWEYAIARKVPALLLLDENIKLTTPLSNADNIIPFDKYHPKKAVAFVENAVKEAQRPLKRDKTNAAAWILGGDSMIELINFLAKTVKKEQLVAA